MDRGAQAYSPAHELGPRKAGLARPNYAKSSVPNCRYLGLLGLRIPATEVGLHPPTYEYDSKTHGVDYLLSIYDFGLTYLFMDGGELADPMDPKFTLFNIKSHQPSGLRWFSMVYFPHPPSPLPSGRGLPLPLPCVEMPPLRCIFRF